MKVYTEKARKVSAYQYHAEVVDGRVINQPTDLRGNGLEVADGDYVVLHRLSGETTVVPADVFETGYDDTGTDDDPDTEEAYAEPAIKQESQPEPTTAPGNPFGQPQPS